MRGIIFGVLVVLPLAACADRYSPNAYSAESMQQANKVDRGTIVSCRVVDVQGTIGVGAMGGAAAGAIGGAQIGNGGGSAVAALGGALIGGVIGALVENKATEAKAYEYVIAVKPDDLVSVTQKDVTPLAIGQRVLVIYGVQARIVPDQSVAQNISP